MSPGARMVRRAGGVERATLIADRIIRRFTSERAGWNANSEALKHLRLVVLAELVRAERERGEG